MAGRPTAFDPQRPIRPLGHTSNSDSTNDFARPSCFRLSCQGSNTMKFLTSVSLAAFLILPSGVSQATTIVDFEDWAGGGGSQTSASSGGFSFETRVGTFFIAPHPAAGNPTQSLHTGSGGFVMTKVDGGPSTLSPSISHGLTPLICPSRGFAPLTWWARRYSFLTVRPMLTKPSL